MGSWSTLSSTMGWDVDGNEPCRLASGVRPTGLAADESRAG